MNIAVVNKTKKLKDISGKKFGKLTALNRECINGSNSFWKCSCECGSFIIVKTGDLNSGHNTSCGCRKRELLGNKFGMLEVIEKLEYSDKYRSTLWKCKCECGNEVILSSSGLTLKTRSCGCIKLISGPKQIYWKGEGDIPASFLSRIKLHAKRRKIEYSLTIKELWDLYEKQKGKCALTGRDLYIPKSLKKESPTASLDRINSDLGYTINNVQWVHKDVNFMKQNFSLEYLLQLCKEVIQYQEHRV